MRVRFSGLEDKKNEDGQGDEQKEEVQVVLGDSLGLSGIIFSY